MSKWKKIESYMDSKSMHESKFNINRKQAQLILDLKKDELKKMRFLAMLDIDKDELKQLAKKDPSIVRAIGKQGGSFRTAMVRKRANEELDMQEAMGVPARFGLSNSEKMKLAKDFDKLASANTTSPNEKIYYKDTAKYFMGKMPDKAFNDMMGGAPAHIGGTIGRRTSAIIGKDKTKKVISVYREEVELDEKEINYDGKGPIKMSKKEYASINKFRKSMIRGKPYVMALNTKNQSTNLVPVIFEEVEIQENFSAGMIDKLRKAYGPMKGKKIVPGPLMKIFDKIDKNKDALIQLFKADIPFVSQMAASRLISKHNMKGKDINKLREDAPTNSVASGGVDMNPTGMSLKKKKELDGRTKEYKIHARKLQAQRERRKLKAQKSICGSFRNGMKENTNNFVREEFIVEDNVDILGQIVRRSQAMPLKFKDGTMKIDLTTANMILKNLVNAPAKFMKGSTRTKVMNIINKGRKDQFLRLIDMLYK